MKFFYILLIFTQTFLNSLPFGLPFRGNFAQPKASSHQQNEDSVLDRNDDETSLTCAGCDCMTCNNTLPAPKKIINPYKQELSNYVPTKPFGNVCIKCAACLAVAYEMENVIRSSSQECETDPEKKKRLLMDIANKIDNLCETGFKNFNLRIYGKHKVITNLSKCTEHIMSKMDGNWTKKCRIINIIPNFVTNHRIALSLFNSFKPIINAIYNDKTIIICENHSSSSFNV